MPITFRSSHRGCLLLYTVPLSAVSASAALLQDAASIGAMGKGRCYCERSATKRSDLLVCHAELVESRCHAELVEARIVTPSAAERQTVNCQL